MALAKINNRRDILLILLYSPGQTDQINEPIVGRTRLLKMMFLFREEVLEHFRKGTEVNEQNFYEFFPWDFGPFSSQVYDDLTFFILRGFVESDQSEEEALPESAAEWDEWLSESGAKDTESQGTYEEESFRLTKKGLDFTKSLYDTLAVAQKQLLVEFKKRLAPVPLRAILQYVYKTYPDTTEKSKIKGEILGNPF
jgi:hypothetical protein